MEERQGRSDWRHDSPDLEVHDGRSPHVFMGLVFVLPAAALSVMLTWQALRELIFGPSPPSYLGQPQLSLDARVVLFAILFVIAAFLCTVGARLIIGVITGRAPRRILPRWLKVGLFGFLTLVPLGLGAFELTQGDGSAAAKGLGAGAFFGVLMYRYGRNLRARPRGDAKA